MHSLFDALICILNTRESTLYAVLRMLASKEHPIDLDRRVILFFVLFGIDSFIFWRIIKYPQIVSLFLHLLYKNSAVLVFRKPQKNSYKLLESKQVLNVKNDYTIVQHIPAKTISHHS
jgi:hypothetical protein